jgi:predicted  nucleic acid-binding Zn-ribbon protein
MDAASQRLNDLHQLLSQANLERDKAGNGQRELRARVKQLEEQLQLATDADDAIMSNVNQTVVEVRPCLP